MKSVVYFLQRENGDIKIGTTSEYHVRLHVLQKQYGALKLLGLLEGGRELERKLHQQFANYRISGTEYFQPHDGLFQLILNKTSLQLPLPLSLRMQSRRLDVQPSKSRLKSRFADMIKDIRAKSPNPISQVDIARGLKVSAPTISRLMRGDVLHMTIVMLERICIYLKCQPGDLLYMDWIAVGDDEGGDDLE